MSAKTILQIKNLDISFRTNAGVVHAIRGINLDLQKGETVAIVGESGSGKSVTMKAAVGLLDSNATINSGEILYTYDDGHGQDKTVDLLKLSKKQLRTEYNGQRLAMVFQDPMTSLDPTMTIGKQIMEGMLLHKHMPKDEARTKALQLLELVGITDAEKRFRNYPHQFSGGQRQRVGIARAMIMDPKLIVADEPISALDVSIRAQVLNLMNKLKAEKNLTYLFIAHDLSVVRFIADRIAVIHLGEIVEIADSETLFQCPLHPYTISLLSAVPMPDPIVERTRRAIVYDPSKLDQSGAPRSLREIRPGHFVLATDKEIEGYEKKLAEVEKPQAQ